MWANVIYFLKYTLQITTIFSMFISRVSLSSWQRGGHLSCAIRCQRQFLRNTTNPKIRGQKWNLGPWQHYSSTLIPSKPSKIEALIAKHYLSGAGITNESLASYKDDGCLKCYLSNWGLRSLIRLLALTDNLKQAIWSADMSRKEN